MPATPATPATPALRLTGPAKRPQDFGFTSGDTHLVVNDAAESLRAFAFGGAQLFTIPALARGQGRENQWTETNTDTPPGLYKIDTIYDDVARVGLSPPYDRTLQSYGWISFDLEELEAQERRHNRAGIMMHGGGSACGWPAAWAPRQPLHPTYGCIRIHNVDLRDRILPLTQTGTVFVSVYQER